MQSLPGSAGDQNAPDAPDVPPDPVTQDGALAADDTGSDDTAVDDTAEGRVSRMWLAADRRNVPLRTIMTTVAVVAATYLAGKLIYRLRDVVLLFAVAGFLALLLNPLLIFTQKHAVRRRGLAVTIVALWSVLVFLGLLIAFGYPLVNGITHLANRLPQYVANAQQNKGWIGHLVHKYHIETWVQRNSPKLINFAQSLSKPALSGNGPEF